MLAAPLSPLAERASGAILRDRLPSAPARSQSLGTGRSHTGTANRLVRRFIVFVHASLTLLCTCTSLSCRLTECPNRFSAPLMECPTSNSLLVMSEVCLHPARGVTDSRDSRLYACCHSACRTEVGTIGVDVGEYEQERARLMSLIRDSVRTRDEVTLLSGGEEEPEYVAYVSALGRITRLMKIRLLKGGGLGRV